MTLKSGNGLHLTAEFSGIQINLKDMDLIRDFLDNFPAKIGMTLVMPAKLIDLDCPDPIDSGISGFCVLAESHVGCHLFPNRKYVMLDVFSCCDFSVEDTMNYLRAFFKPKREHFNVETRGWLMDDYLEFD